MNTEKLFEAMGAIDEDILERSEAPEQPKRRFRLLEAIAACCVFAVCLGAVYALVQNRTPPHTAAIPSEVTTSEVTTATQPLSEVVDYPFYNERCYYLFCNEWLCYTVDALSPEETRSLLPNTLADWMDFTGEIMFLEDGTPHRLYLSTPTTVEGVQIQIIIGQSLDLSYDAGPNPVYYRCGETEYAMWERVPTDSTKGEIGARATICGMAVYIYAEAWSEDVERAKADFEELLGCFSTYPADGLDYSKITSTSQPESWRLPCTREEICRESEYAVFLPEEDDWAYTDTTITWDYIWGYSEKQTNISVTDFRNYEQFLGWTIYSTAEEWTKYLYAPLLDARELTLEAVELALTDSDFSVDYGDAIVCLDAKGVSAQWLYKQLIAVRQRLDLARFESMVETGLPEGVSLKIYYMDPKILTRCPLSADDLKAATKMAKTIIVDRQSLQEQASSLKKLSPSVIRTPDGTAYQNARMCYVFQDAQGNTLLEVAINHPDGWIFVNGEPVEYDRVYLEAIEPFLTEDFYSTWKLD